MADEYVPYEGPIVTRVEALSRKLPRYFTGKSCKHGHLSERQVSSRGCISCAKGHNQNWRSVNQDHLRKYEIDRYRREVDAGVFRSRDWYNNNKQKASKRYRAYRAANPDIVRSATKRWRENNADRVRAQKNLWAKNNPDKTRTNQRNQRAKRRSSVGKHTISDVRWLLKKQKGRCANSSCGKKILCRFHVDHVQPLKLGGRNDIRNLQLLCPSCNLRKGIKDPIRWARDNWMLC